MKRRDLLARIQVAARDRGRRWDLTRQGAAHELWSLDGHMVTIPRHREINESTARSIMRELETELGEGWWR